MSKGATKPWVIFAVGAAALAGLGGYAAWQTHRPPLLELYVFDVSGGPAIFIRTPEDRRVLINGGSNTEIIRHLTDLLPFYSRRIDMVVATDTEGKHVSGLIDVLERYTVDIVILPAVTLTSLGISSTTDAIYRTFLETVEEKGIAMRELVQGDRVSLDSKITTEVLFPVQPQEFEYSKASGPELLFRLEYGKNSIALMGQASPKIQKFVAVKQIAKVRIDALVINYSPTESNLALELMNSFKPNFLVYAQTIQKETKPKPKTANKKEKPDPVAGVLKDMRFNIRERGSVRITSDGKEVSLTL